MAKRDIMKSEICGDIVRLKRNQWKGYEAQISNYPGLLDEVQKYTWTYSSGKHPYLNCSKLNTSLHKFVLAFLYGEDKLNQMLTKNNIIEHIDNDGLNCSYENLHVLSADLNIAKAFTIDKATDGEQIPSFITDVYYSHKKQHYQLQLFLNRDLYYLAESYQPIEQFFCQYTSFENLFIDWLYLVECKEQILFDITKFHTDKIIVKLRPILLLKEDEKDSVVIKRDGKYYLRLETEEPGRIAFMKHISFKEID